MRPRKACNYLDLRSFGWGAVRMKRLAFYIHSGKLGNRSEARASDLGSYPGLGLVESNKAKSLRRQEN